MVGSQEPVLLVQKYVSATPESASDAVKVTVSGFSLMQPSGASSVVSGFVLSTFTVTFLTYSTFPPSVNSDRSTA